MQELFQQVVAWVAANPVWTGIFIFISSMFESMAVLGLIVPGVPIMFAIGTLVAAGAISFWPTMALATLGAIAGDGVSFWLGQRYKEQLRGMWPFNRHPEQLARGIVFFQKYGGKSVVIGRFFGPVRAVIPLVAGMMDMPPRRFLFANILSAVAWAPVYLAPGILFGASLELAAEVTFRMVFLLVLLVALVWGTTWGVHRAFNLLHPHSRGMVQWALRWGDRHPLVGGVITALADPHHPEAKGLSLLASLLIVATGLFALLLGVVLERSALATVDQMVLLGLQSLHTPLADHLMLYLSRFGDTEVLLLTALAVTGFCAIRRNGHTALYWGAAIAFCAIAPWLLKVGLQVPRPEVVTMPPDGYSFPSSHALRATVIYGLLAVTVARPLREDWRWLPYSLASLPILAVAFARLYLGVHWFSDVVGGILLGILWVAALGLAFHTHTSAAVSWRGLSAIALGTIFLSWGLLTGVRHDQDRQANAPRVELRNLAAMDWWQQGWHELPASITDLRNRASHPFNVQVAGSLDGLRQALESAGWIDAPMVDWENGLRLLSPSLPLQELPVLPKVHAGRHEDLVLAKSVEGGGRLVLRLWDGRYRLLPGDEPVWIGYVAAQRRAEVLGLISFAAADLGGDGNAFRLLVADTARLGPETRALRDNEDLLLHFPPAR